METTKGYGLKPLPEDPRDFKLGALYGTVDTKGIPDDFVVAEPLKIKDQRTSDFCTAYALTAVSEDQEGVELSPEFQFYVTKKGDTSWGADLRQASDTICKFGSLEQSEANKTIFDKYDREKILASDSWPVGVLSKARLHAKKSYVRINGNFDEIRAALWKFRNEKRTIVAGALWRNEWTHAHKGIIPKVYGTSDFGHAFKFFGQKKINGELYLMAQLSSGTEIGDGGIFYFPKEVVDKEVSPYGAFMFMDMEPDMAKYYMENGIKVDENWLRAVAKAIAKLLSDLLKKKL